MNESQELDYRKHKDRVFRVRVGAPEKTFRNTMISSGVPYLERFSVFPTDGEDIKGTGEYQYQHFVGNFTGQEIEQIRKDTNANNCVGNIALDVLPVWKIDRITIPQVIQEVTECLKRYKEVKFHASKPWIPGGSGNNNQDFNGIYDLVIFTLDKLDPEELLFGKLKDKYYYLERERYYSGFDYLPKIKDTHDGFA